MSKKKKLVTVSKSFVQQNKFSTRAPSAALKIPKRYSASCQVLSSIGSATESMASVIRSSFKLVTSVRKAWYFTQPHTKKNPKSLYPESNWTSEFAFAAVRQFCSTTIWRILYKVRVLSEINCLPLFCVVFFFTEVCNSVNNLCSPPITYLWATHWIGISPQRHVRNPLPQKYSVAWRYKGRNLAIQVRWSSFSNFKWNCPDDREECNGTSKLESHSWNS
jgi:hypothetical protein